MMRGAIGLLVAIALSGCVEAIGSIDDPLDAGAAADAGLAADAGSVDLEPGAAAPVAPPASTAAPLPDPEIGWSAERCPRVRVTTRGVPLNVRPEASTARAAVGSLEPGTVVEVRAAVTGERIDGIDLWYEIVSGSLRGFIYSGYAACTAAPETFGELDGFYLPLECGSRVRISQGNDGTFSHRGTSVWAFDFSVGTGTAVLAMADGIVIGVHDATGPGDPCYDGGGRACGPHANRVVIRHADGFATQYGHLSRVSVSVGDGVRRGAVVGLSGTTGYSTGPHLHAQRQEICASLSCQSVPLRFVDVPGDGVPSTGDTVTSGNCP